MNDIEWHSDEWGSQSINENDLFKKMLNYNNICISVQVYDCISYKILTVNTQTF